MKRREFLAITGAGLGSTFIPPRALKPHLPTPETNSPNGPAVRIVGIGGAGGNMLNRVFVERPWPGAQTLAINLDAQALTNNMAETKLQIGEKLTRGLGAGARPEIGRRGAIESYEEIQNALSDAELVILQCGLGGGTGTGAAPYVATAAKKAGALSIGIVTLPFNFEGRKRWRQAQLGLADLAGKLDSLIVLPQEATLETIGRDVAYQEALRYNDRQVIAVIRTLHRIATKFKHQSLAQEFSPIIGDGVVRFGCGIGERHTTTRDAVREALTNPYWRGAKLRHASGTLVDLQFQGGLHYKEHFWEDATDSTELINRALPRNCYQRWTCNNPDGFSSASAAFLARFKGPGSMNFSTPRAAMAGSRFRRARRV